MTKDIQATACILHGLFDMITSKTNIGWHTEYAEDRNEHAAFGTYKVQAIWDSLFHLRVLMGVAKRIISQDHGYAPCALYSCDQ